MELDSITDSLTVPQREAVTHGEGPLLIVAGAGTGKTSVLTRRVAHLITSGQAKPCQVLALTFTDKAAQEMQERLDLLLPYGYSDVTVSTFHAFGDRILRQYALEFGLDPDFRILSTAEQVLFLRKFLFDLPLKRYRPLGNPTSYLRSLVGHFSKLKDESVHPDRYVEWAEELAETANHSGNLTWADRAAGQLELARCYQFYQRKLLEEGCLDFGDLVFLTLRLFRERPAVLERVQERFSFVLVDEFQDTNSAQFELVRLLVQHHQNLSVVGDDDQSIYAFRGAAIANILSFLDFYPQAKKIVLKDNFRSRQEILDAAYLLIQQNNPERLEVKSGIDKKLRASGLWPALEHEPIVYHQFETVTEEADAVADQIQQWQQSGRYRFSDVAILVRVNREADAYLRSLNLRGIPYRFSGSEGLYNRPEIRLLLAFIRVLCDPRDSVSLFYLASSPLYKFPMQDLMRRNAYANERHLPLLQALASEDGPGLTPDAVLVCERLLADYRQFVDAIPHTSPGRLLFQFMEHTQWLKLLASGEIPDGEAQLHNIARFFDGVRRFEDDSKGALLPQFIEHLDLLIEAGDSPGVVEADPGEEAVQILTVHRSKGLEFPVVFMVGLAETRFPTRPRSDILEFPANLVGRQNNDPSDELSFHHQEERRLFYVGLTRAKERLWLSNPLDFGGRGTRPASRFLREALAISTRSAPVQRASSLERVRRMAPTQTPDDLPPVPPHAILPLSYARVRDYRECPMKYKFRHVLRVPIASDHATVYGTAMHEAVSSYLKALQQGISMTLPELQNRFRDKWTSAGFLSPEHERQRFEAGQLALTRFYERQLRDVVPVGVEQEFAIRLDNVRLQGRFDRVDRSHDRVCLTDYKTAEVRSQSQADEQARSSLQLAIYALGYWAGQKVMPHEIRLHFLDSDVVGSARVGQEHLSTAHQQVMEAAAGIRERDYEPRPEFGVCGRCPYREICPRTAS